MPNYQITDRALQLSNTYSQPYQLKNSGSKTIYLSKGTEVSSTAYDWTLVPGDRISFGAEDPLYLICAPGETSAVEQQYGAMNSFTPAPAEFSIDYSVRLLAEFTLANPHVPITNITLGPAELGSAASIAIQINADNALAVGNYSVVSVGWLDDSGLVFVQIVRAYMSQDGSIYWRVPRLSNNVIISIIWNSTTHNVNGSVYATPDATDFYMHNYNYYPNQFGWAAIAGVSGFSTADSIVSLQALATFTKNAGNYEIGIPTIAGQMKFNLVNGDALTGCWLVPLNTITFQHRYEFAFTGGTAEGEFIATRVPLKFQIGSATFASPGNVLLASLL